MRKVMLLASVVSLILGGATSAGAVQEKIAPVYDFCYFGEEHYVCPVQDGAKAANDIIEPAGQSADDSFTSTFGSGLSLKNPDESAPAEDSLTWSLGVTPGETNPWGCIGRSDNPHLSAHRPGRVAAQGHTICQVPVPSIQVTSTLFRWRGWWWQPLDSDSDKNAFSGRARAIVSWDCRNTTYTYLIVSHHKIKGWDGKTYRTVTSNSARLAC